MCGENPTLTNVKQYDYEEFVGESCSTGINFSGNQVEWKEFLESVDKESDVVIDVRPTLQHDLINFTEKNANVHHMPLGDMTKLTKEDITEKFNIEDESTQKSKLLAK